MMCRLLVGQLKALSRPTYVGFIPCISSVITLPFLLLILFPYLTLSVLHQSCPEHEDNCHSLQMPATHHISEKRQINDSVMSHQISYPRGTGEGLTCTPTSSFKVAADFIGEFHLLGITWWVILNKLHHKKVVGRWLVSGRPPTDHQRSFKDPSTKVFFIFHFRCFLCYDGEMP